MPSQLSQGEQLRSEEVVGATLSNVSPTTQVVTDWQEDPCPMPALNVCPRAQKVQTRSASAVASAEAIVPGAQFVHGVHLATLLPVEKPPTQGEHSRSLSGVPSTDTYVPGGQSW